ncbi:MAG: NAD(P)H-hydrate dehydratase [Fidelibacterota bacterium]
MRILSTQEARAVDHHTSQNLGVKGEILMQNAGAAIAEKVRKIFTSEGSKSIIVLCGKGNNGGDGYAAAELLVAEGFNCNVVSTVAIQEITGDARIFHDRCIEKGLAMDYLTNPGEVPFSDYDLILDALLGTGIKGQVREDKASWIQAINSADVPVLAVDIPSGVNGDNGQISGLAVKADCTVTMGFLKQGLVLEPGASLAGEIVVADIGYPERAFNVLESQKELFKQSLAQQYLTTPEPHTYKHRQGKVLVIAGSRGFTGAGCLAAEAALRTGAGLVIAAVPASLNFIYESKLTEVITTPLADGGSGQFRLADLRMIEEKLKWCDALIIGPGLGTEKESLDFAKEVINKCDKPMVIDADALKLFHEDLNLFNKLKSSFVITPHYGEAAQLFQVKKDIVSTDPFDFVLKGWKEIGGTFVLKGAPTLVATDGSVTANISGHQGLATGGSGDVLSGVIGSFLAQGLRPAEAARIGVFIHGKAADKLLSTHGFRGLIAGDLLSILPSILIAYERK